MAHTAKRRGENPPAARADGGERVTPPFDNGRIVNLSALLGANPPCWPSGNDVNLACAQVERDTLRQELAEVLREIPDQECGHA